MVTTVTPTWHDVSNTIDDGNNGDDHLHLNHYKLRNLESNCDVEQSHNGFGWIGFCGRDKIVGDDLLNSWIRHDTIEHETEAREIRVGLPLVRP